jgi:hypothetical protein
MEPGFKRGVTFVIGREDAPVGPLDLQGAVEPFDLAVLPRTVRLDEDVARPDASHDGGDVATFLVAEVVVGHHRLDALDPVRGERGRGSGKEAGAGGAPFIGQDLGVGQPGVVIDEGVDVVVADAGSFLGTAAANGASVGAPAATVGEAADLLDVHVDQLAGVVLLVTDRGGLGGADHLPGHRVALAQVRHLVTAQDPRHRSGRDAQLVADPVLSAPLLFTAGQHRLLHRRRGAPGRAARSRGTVSEPCLALGVEPGQPAVGTLS